MSDHASSPHRTIEPNHTAQSPVAHLIIRASAGTGKTYQLTARLLRILLQGAAPESILATTFTRKAAGEILDRILLTGDRLFRHVSKKRPVARRHPEVIISEDALQLLDHVAWRGRRAGFWFAHRSVNYT